MEVQETCSTVSWMGIQGVSPPASVGVSTMEVKGSFRRRRCPVEYPQDRQSVGWVLQEGTADDRIQDDSIQHTDDRLSLPLIR